MKIKELVFNKRSGDLIGFTHLGNVNNILKQLHTQEIKIATSMLTVTVRGLTKGFNFPYACFPSSRLNGEKIAFILMEATFLFERMGLKVIMHSLDRCSNNRKYFHLMSIDKSNPYKTKNPFTSENRYIFFVSDPPHILKTRNCLYNPRRKL